MNAPPASACEDVACEDVLRLRDTDRAALTRLLEHFGLKLTLVPAAQEIPASYWGESEAGLREARLFARLDTPVHSVLHESSHFICMSPERRGALDRDAGGEDLEEAAVCYLQILLAADLAGVGSGRLMQDMDRWGYSFRLGSTRAWFDEDAADARDWLVRYHVLDAAGRPHRCRHDPAAPTAVALPDNAPCCAPR
jgi:hypothetical protein